MLLYSCCRNRHQNAILLMNQAANPPGCRSARTPSLTLPYNHTMTACPILSGLQHG